MRETGHRQSSVRDKRQTDPCERDRTHISVSEKRQRPLCQRDRTHRSEEKGRYKEYVKEKWDTQRYL